MVVISLYLERESIYIPSLGYADDTTIIAQSLIDLKIQNDWVKYFMQFNRMRLNYLKCKLVGRQADGTAIDDALIAAYNICIEGHALVSHSHDVPLRYLGVEFCFNGD